ncbi:hypothetical protein GB937_010523 [Aspergillus fischeri]|nr:hypothetical protein GB937_010523 [Aspergillus fischeri]
MAASCLIAAASVSTSRREERNFTEFLYPKTSESETASLLNAERKSPQFRDLFSGFLIYILI